MAAYLIMPNLLGSQVSQSLDTKRLTPIKEVLGEDYSWDEIRLVLAKNERYDLFD